MIFLALMHFLKEKYCISCFGVPNNSFNNTYKFVCIIYNSFFYNSIVKIQPLVLYGLSGEQGKSVLGEVTKIKHPVII